MMKTYFCRWWFLLLLPGSAGAICGQVAQAQPALTITHLTGHFYVYTTYVAGFPSNGLYLVTGKGVVVIDSPYDTTQFQPLLDSIRQRHHQPVVLCIATHFHEDRTGWLEFLRARGVKTYTSRLTDEYSRGSGKKRAEFLFDKDTSFTVGGYSFQTYFPGEGHTKDNIVLWFGKDRVLYGGCLVKSTAATDLGNTRDANIQAYPETIRRVQETFPDPAYVIPGHQSWADTASLRHTLQLSQRAKDAPAK
jgi:glyoxylase-like metal-dependent hydrolase (beta-lactamase superfamily II)